MTELAGRTALVTGGSRGIGQGIAIELAAAGANVVFTYHSGKDGAEETGQRITEAGGVGRAVRCNVADLDEVEAGADPNDPADPSAPSRCFSRSFPTDEPGHGRSRIGRAASAESDLR